MQGLQQIWPHFVNIVALQGSFNKILDYKVLNYREVTTSVCHTRKKRDEFPVPSISRRHRHPDGSREIDTSWVRTFHFCSPFPAFISLSLNSVRQRQASLSLSISVLLSFSLSHLIVLIVVFPQQTVPLHLGAPCSSRMWPRLLPVIAEKTRRAVPPNYLGTNARWNRNHLRVLRLTRDVPEPGWKNDFCVLRITSADMLQFSLY